MNTVANMVDRIIAIDIAFFCFEITDDLMSCAARQELNDGNLSAVDLHAFKQCVISGLLCECIDTRTIFIPVCAKAEIAECRWQDTTLANRNHALGSREVKQLCLFCVFLHKESLGSKSPHMLNPTLSFAFSAHSEHSQYLEVCSNSVPSYSVR